MFIIKHTTDPTSTAFHISSFPEWMVDIVPGVVAAVLPP